MKETTYQPTQAQIDKARAQDLSTYDGWIAAAKALLEGAPAWTALVDRNFHDVVGYVAVDADGFLCAVAYESPCYVYSADDLIDFDRSAWEGGCFEGGNPDDAQAVILTPSFVQLSYSDDDGKN